MILELPPHDEFECCFKYNWLLSAGWQPVPSHMQISNRIKSKGLQKLRFFCQMCQKQCRDENGFKCHLNSESHKRQMEIFGQNADRVIAGYSEEFEADFMELMRRSHPRARVAAKNVYNEFIADKYHVHMNSTKWYTLTEFVKYLGKTGKKHTPSS